MESAIERPLEITSEGSSLRALAEAILRRELADIMHFEENWQTRPMRTSHVIDLMTLTPEQTPSPA